MELDAVRRDVLDDEGYVILRGAVGMDDVDRLRLACEAGELGPGDWPVPRAPDWRHSQVDLDVDVRRVCRLPVVLDAVRHVLRERYFLAQVEGREPRLGGGSQLLHRDDLAAEWPQSAYALVFLDEFGAANGATRFVAGSHRGGGLEAPAGLEHPLATTVHGDPGDVVVFGGTVLHGATVNSTGDRRRALLIAYCILALEQDFRVTRALRGVRMDLSEVFGG